MTPLSRRKSARATRNIRFVIASAALIVGLASIHGTAEASRTTSALPSLKGLTEQVDFGDSLRERVVQAGMEAIGTPYVFGGDDPEDGFDCSGLVSFVFKEIAGLNLPRRAIEQRAEGKNVSRAKLQPGDLVFFATTRNRARVSHVGIYIGDGKFVHAPRRGSNVKVSSMGEAYWSKRYKGARAYIEEPTLGTARLLAQNTR
ncbi:MAG: C40 family peptidase [Burkholderiaceae bacterium]|nr:C40 family peptidase [Burkholderiaceae bacterium]